MLRYRAILIITYVCLAISGIWSKYMYYNLPCVTLIKPDTDNISEAVHCKGTVKVAQYGVFTSVTSEVEEVYVSEGQKVLKNDPLIKTTATEEASEVMAQVESYKNSLQNDYIETLSAILESLGVVIPENSIPAASLSEYEPVVQDGNYLYSPVDGIITDICTESGGVKLGLEPIVTVSDYSDVVVSCRINEDSLNKVRIGQKVEISGSGFNKKFIGTVSDISNTASASLLPGNNSLIDLEITVFSPDKELLNGLSASCKIITETEYDAITIPGKCIFQDNNGMEFVMLYNNGAVEYRNVDCVYYSANKVKVSGIEPTDNIILSEKLIKEFSKVLIDEDV